MSKHNLENVNEVIHALTDGIYGCLETCRESLVSRGWNRVEAHEAAFSEAVADLKALRRAHRAMREKSGGGPLETERA